MDNFELYCQKVLPLVYDDSLSYYEAICKLAKGLEILNSDNTEIRKEITELKEYVDNYFKTVDIYDEIRENLENLGETGQLQKFLNAYMLYNKKCVFLGDSLFWGDSGNSEHTAVSTPIPNYIKTITGCNAVSYARKSATMSTYLNTDSNTLKNQLETGNLINADYVFIEFFTNDMVKNVPFGDIDSNDWNTFCGGLNNAINYINSVAPKSTVLVMGITPSNRYFNKTRNNFRTIIDSYNECLINVCKRMNVKYVNLLNCGINRSNFSSFSPDGTHFNQNGYDKLALCILQNLGGNNLTLTDGENKFNNNMYPSYNKINEYAVRLGNENTPYNTYVDTSLKSGLYRIKFKYKCECGVYDAHEYFLGVHVYIGSNFLVSPIGLKNGEGEVNILTNLDKPLTGKLALRSTHNDPSLTVEQITISDFELIPITGDLSMDIMFDADNTITDYYNGYIRVRRTKGGTIDVKCVGKATQDIPAYTPFIKTSALQHIINVSETLYFAMFYGTESARGQLTNSGVACSSVITSGTTIAFSFSL